MSIFASYVTRTVPLPFDEPQTVTIQKLSGQALAAARQAQVAASMDLVKSMGGPAFGRELAQLTTGDGRSDDVAAAVADQAAKVRADPARQYDRPTVLAKGITGWSYPDPVTPDRLDDLDEQAADFLFRAILDLTLPNGAAEKKKQFLALHRALDGEGPLPLEYVVARICEEFHCLPSAAWREWLDLPAGFLETMLDYRAYARAKATYDARGQRTHDAPLTDQVMAHDFLLVNERRSHV